MPIRREKIDRAIVMTQSDLRGFWHPLGFRVGRAKSSKSHHALTCNLMAFVLLDDDGNVLDGCYVDRRDASYEDYLAMCQEVCRRCTPDQKEAIQLIILDIFTMGEEIKVGMVSGDIQTLGYLGPIDQPLDKSSVQGRAVFALAEAFGVDLETKTCVPVWVPESDS